MVSHLDAQIGRLINYLKESGLMENTFIVFTSDNGPAYQGSPGPFKGGKTDLHEGGIRVPMIASWPVTLAKGKVISDPVISLDLLPTFTAVAGRQAKHPLLEGKNLLPWLTGKAECPNVELFWSWRETFNAVRIGTLKEIRNGKPV